MKYLLVFTSIFILASNTIKPRISFTDKNLKLKRLCDTALPSSVVIVESAKFCSACPQEMQQTIKKLSKLTKVYLLTKTSTPINLRYKLNSYGFSKKANIIPIYYDSLSEDYSQLPSPYYITVGKDEDYLTFTSSYTSTNQITKHLKQQIKTLKKKLELAAHP